MKQQLGCNNCGGVSSSSELKRSREARKFSLICVKLASNLVEISNPQNASRWKPHSSSHSYYLSLLGTRRGGRWVSCALLKSESRDPSPHLSKYLTLMSGVSGPDCKDGFFFSPVIKAFNFPSVATWWMRARRGALKGYTCARRANIRQAVDVLLRCHGSAGPLTATGGNVASCFFCFCDFLLSVICTEDRISGGWEECRVLGIHARTHTTTQQLTTK